jgi:hypothetical protein
VHHFEDLKAQSSFFRGLGRDNSAQQDYRAVEILPFNSTQIQSMLKKQPTSCLLDEVLCISGYFLSP